MSEDPNQSLGSGLAFEADIPLRWHPGDPGRRARNRQANEDVLRLIFGLDDHRQELSDEDPAIAHELARLDFKVNLLLDLVGQALLAQLELPPLTAVRLGGEGISWQSANPPETGSQVELELFLDLKYPRPVLLPGRVDAVEGDRVSVRFEELGEGVQDWLEKFIFRYHRRRVAQIRREH